ncbi:MAG: MacB family efflux pump subunit [Elusimicrobia bacterium HGW-Elusimicrobia-4]|nr:MAG: MacB family efflux pump subunit [Elusimicrobia bacterium HGW-Elusimicrobia-4]
MIEIKDISKTYHLGEFDVPALRGVSIEIEQGEFVSIMGASGSGKSTLLHILGLLDKPTSGSYKLEGREISGFSDDELATLRNKFLGFVFQQFNLLPRTSAKENVELPLIYSADQKFADTAVLLKKVGLADRIYHKPNELSGGQQQRVAIARALINNPLLIFADEPTGNLDSKSASEIIEILKELNNAGITIVMVTHEPDLASAASRIITLQDGKIISDKLQPTFHKLKTKITGLKQSSISENHFLHPVFKLQSMSNYFFQAVRALLSNKTRSVLSILGVLIGVTSVIAMLALGTGAKEDVKKRISSLGSNLLTVRASSHRVGGVSMESGTVTRFTIEDANEIREKISGIDKVAAHVMGRGQVVYQGKNWNTQIQGTTEDYPYMRNDHPVMGRFFTKNETITRTKVAVIGQTIVKELFGDKNPLGEFIKIKRIDFQVIGILPTKGSSGWQNEDDKIIIPLNTAMYRLLGKEYVDQIGVQVTDANLMDTVSAQIKKLIIALHRLPESQSDTIDIRNMADIQETVTSTVKTFAYLLGSIAFINLLVGGIGIMNIMLVSVTERTREIGLRKAVGADNNDILFQFMIESVVICVLGGIIGIMLGSLISFTLSKFAGWSTRISLSSVLLAFTFSVAIGLIFGIWPAKKASQLNPIDALRYE